MEENKTTLQKIVEQKAEQIKNAIEQAIENSANIEHSTYISNGYMIDGIFIQKTQTNIVICLNMESEKIAKACEPSKDELKKMAEQKRAELEEIENKLKLNEQ